MARDANGGITVLLGTAVDVNDGSDSPVKELSSSDLSDQTQYWSGRWVLIHSQWLQMDAAGLLGCFLYKGCGSTDLCVEQSRIAPFLRRSRCWAGGSP